MRVSTPSPSPTLTPTPTPNPNPNPNQVPVRVCADCGAAVRRRPCVGAVVFARKDEGEGAHSKCRDTDRQIQADAHPDLSLSVQG